MSSATTLLQSDVESSSTTSEADTSSLEAALTTTHTVKMLMDKGESKVSYGYDCSFETSKSSDVCQLRIKPLSLKFWPRYEAAGDEFWRAGLQLASMASSQQLVEEGCAAMQRAAACYVHAGLYIRSSII